MLLLVFLPLVTASPSTQLFFSAPATDFNSALPVGNGRLGAMVYGLVDNEKISLNEDSIWSGGFLDRVNPKANATFPTVRKLMNAGNLTGAGNEWLLGMGGTPDEERSYDPAGQLNIGTGHKSVTDYSRSLDVGTGIAAVSYVYNGVQFSREVFGSFPAGVIVARFSANKTGSLDLNVTLSRSKSVSSVTVSESKILLRGTGSKDSTYTFTSGLRTSVSEASGRIEAKSTSISISNADTVTLLWDAETLFRYPNGAYDTVLNNKLAEAASTSFDTLRSEAVRDFQSQFDRSGIVLGNGTSVTDTGKRLAAVNASNSLANDPQLLALAYNFGKHLMISSARNGSLPPNLQGNWNEEFSPPWSSKYTIDINLQMNYWFTDVNRLDDSKLPLWDHLLRMQTRGKDVARKMYNANGWMCHHNTDLWGDCAPVDNGTQWTIWPMGSAWMLAHVIDHYRYTQDAAFTAQYLPLVEDALEFYYDYLVLEAGFYQNYPSISPENSYPIPNGDTLAGSSTGIDKSTQMDRALLWNLFRGYIELAGAAKSTSGVAKAESYLGKMRGPTVSNISGRLLEWSQDFKKGGGDGHRHFSPLWGLHPGTQYSLLTNETVGKAAQAFLQNRMDKGSGSTGWSRIWSSILFSRCFDSDHAMTSITTLFAQYMYANLFSITSATYQIDANFGLVTAVNEMFLQSNNGVVHLGPAIPKTLASGSFTTWQARGGFTVSANWSGGHITSSIIVSSSGASLAVRVEDGKSFSVNGTAYSKALNTVKGGIYVVKV